MNYMSVDEFQEKGYLQELNRQFLHPLGLALEVKVYNSAPATIEGIRDFRNEEIGYMFKDLSGPEAERKYNYVLDEKTLRHCERLKTFGSVEQPIGSMIKITVEEIS